MIKAKELRIGNWYEVDGKQIQFKDYLIVDNVSKIVCGFRFERLNGIPLTPDILIACGFEFSKCGISGADMWQGMAFWKHENLNLRGNLSRSKNGILHLEGYFNTQIQYLHQLQNLYYSLTNSEIKINL